MFNQTTTELRDPLFLNHVFQIKEKMGKEPISDRDILIIAFEEISRTYTHDEKNYTA